MDASSLITEITENVHADLTMSANDQIYSDLQLLVKFEKKNTKFWNQNMISVCNDLTVKFAKWRIFVSQTKIFRDFVLNQGKSNFNNFHENVKPKPLSYLC